MEKTERACFLCGGVPPADGRVCPGCEGRGVLEAVILEGTNDAELVDKLYMNNQYLPYTWQGA